MFVVGDDCGEHLRLPPGRGAACSVGSISGKHTRTSDARSGTARVRNRRYRIAAGQTVSVDTAVGDAGIETRIRAYISRAALRRIVYADPTSFRKILP